MGRMRTIALLLAAVMLCCGLSVGATATQEKKEDTEAAVAKWRDGPDERLTLANFLDMVSLPLTAEKKTLSMLCKMAGTWGDADQSAYYADGEMEG